MSHITCKFGGTSLADETQVAKAIAIIKANSGRRHIVVSAPGKRFAGDEKVTDLFYAWQAAKQAHVSSSEIRQKIEQRYLQIIRGLCLEADLTNEFNSIEKRLSMPANSDQELSAARNYAASRGEYLMAKWVMAPALGFGFVDPAICIRIDKNGLPNSFATYDLTAQAVGRAGGKCVMAGFYGSTLDGKEIRTFSRGGSDISGAILARAVGAQVYENWSDVDGMLAADPRVVSNPRLIRRLSYQEARELSYMGFVVIHPEALYPVQQAGKPIYTHLLNTNNPMGAGTKIVPASEMPVGGGGVVGIAGRKSFVVIDIDRALMNQSVGFGRKALAAVERQGVSYEHSPSSIDSISIVIDPAQLGNGRKEAIVADIRRECEPDDVNVYSDIALVAVVGNGMIHTRGVAARIFATIDAANVNIRLINQGASERNIIVGVQDDDYEKTILALYNEFFEPKPV